MAVNPGATKVVSFNMHGFNQGSSLLKDLCNPVDMFCDIILVQEHWLTSDNMIKLNNFSTLYSFYGISAMEQVVKNSVLKGRPWEGVGVLVKNNLSKSISFSLLKERFVIIVVGKIILVNA